MFCPFREPDGDAVYTNLLQRLSTVQRILIIILLQHVTIYFLKFFNRCILILTIYRFEVSRLPLVLPIFDFLLFACLTLLKEMVFSAMH